MKILVADDSDEFRAEVLDTLQAFGHTTVGVRNGGEAIVEALTEKFDLVLTDCNMPKLRGYQVIKAIKKEKPSVRIIMMSSDVTALMEKVAVKLGAEAVVQKMFIPEALKKFGV